MTRRLVHLIGSLAIAAALSLGGGAAALAQENIGSAVSVGGGTAGVGAGETVVVAPGVTISSGDVVNDTGIGVIAGGGSSIGATAGGGDNASVTE